MGSVFFFQLVQFVVKAIDFVFIGLNDGMEIGFIKVGFDIGLNVILNFFGLFSKSQSGKGDVEVLLCRGTAQN